MTELKQYCEYCGAKLFWTEWKELGNGYDPYTGKKRESTYTSEGICPNEKCPVTVSNKKLGAGFPEGRETRYRDH